MRVQTKRYREPLSVPRQSADVSTDINELHFYMHVHNFQIELLWGLTLKLQSFPNVLASEVFFPII